MGNNEDEKQKNVQPSDNKTTLPPTLSPKEVRKVVKSFVMAWLTGTIEINFPTAQEIARNDIHPFRLSPMLPQGEYMKKELELKQPFLDYVSIFLGRKTASDEEKLNATNELFDWLIVLQSARRIKGQFMEIPDVENRLARLERDIYKLERLFDEMKTLLKGAGILR